MRRKSACRHRRPQQEPPPASSQDGCDTCHPSHRQPRSSSGGRWRLLLFLLLASWVSSCKGKHRQRGRTRPQLGVGFPLPCPPELLLLSRAARRLLFPFQELGRTRRFCSAAFSVSFLFLFCLPKSIPGLSPSGQFKTYPLLRLSHPHTSLIFLKAGLSIVLCFEKCRLFRFLLSSAETLTATGCSYRP